MKLRLIFAMLICIFLCSCVPNYRGEIPNLEFEAVKYTNDGKPCGRRCFVIHSSF